MIAAKIRKPGKSGRLIIRKTETFASYAGWMAAICNFTGDPKEALQIYRNKDIVEKNFDRLKNFIDLSLFSMQSNAAMANKMFIAFISLILHAWIDNAMLEKKLCKKWTMTELIKAVEKREELCIKGKKIIHPLASKRKDKNFFSFWIEIA
jgi:transposase